VNGFADRKPFYGVSIVTAADIIKNPKLNSIRSVMIHLKQPASAKGVSCTGTFITNSVFLTAHHCFDEYGEGESVSLIGTQQKGVTNNGLIFLSALHSNF